MADLSSLLPPAFLVGLISLDRTAVGQAMVSSPLVGGWLMGWLLGDPSGGLAAGAFLQFLCFVDLPVGATVPIDGTLAGLIGTALFLTASRPPGWSDSAMIGAAVLLFFPLASLARFMEVKIYRVNHFWTAVAVSQAERGRLGAAQLASLGGIPLFFLKAAFLTLLVLLLFPLLAAAFPAGVSALGRPLAVLARLAPFAGLALLATSQRRLRPVSLLGLGFLLGAVVTWTAR